MRSAHWAHRAVTEYERSARTWLGTITLSGFEHARLDAAVAAKAQETGAFVQTEWTARDYFRERCEVFGSWISLWLKRVRVAEQRRRLSGRGLQEPKGSPLAGECRAEGPSEVVPPSFSYLLVAEMHKNGRPHWHILLHEDNPFELIRADEYYVTQKGVVRVDEKAMIRQSWQLGFTQFELCRDSRSAGYLCKYLSKDMLWRVRASKAYGQEKATSEDECGAPPEARLPLEVSSSRAAVAAQAKQERSDETYV